MACFCNQCALRLGLIPGDFVGLGSSKYVLCEGCGSTTVNNDGDCISTSCLLNHNSHPVNQTRAAYNNGLDVGEFNAAFELFCTGIVCVVLVALLTKWYTISLTTIGHLALFLLGQFVGWSLWRRLM